MKRFIRCVCLVLVLALTLPIAAFAEKQEDTSSTYSYYFSSYSTWITKITDRTMQIGFELVTRGAMDELGASSIVLQCSTNGTSGWSDVKTFTPDKYAQMLDYDSGSHMECVNYTGDSGYYYRAYVTFYARNSSGFAEGTLYSNVVRIY